jgi:REP element-mobilizing transposase RayT
MSYTSLLFHYVFATKERGSLITDDLQSRLWAYMGGIARANGLKALEVGGMPDHVHLLISLPPTMPVAKAMQLIKAGSSLWMHETAGRPRFQWQEKYGAFSIGISQKDVTARYIRNQKKHHAKVNFREEWKAILKRHGMAIEE